MTGSIVTADNMTIVLTCVYRMLLNAMYTMVETLRCPDDSDTDDWKRLRENFRSELSTWSQIQPFLLAQFS